MKVRLVSRKGEEVTASMAAALAALFGAYALGSFHWLLAQALRQALQAIPPLAALLVLAIGIGVGWAMRPREKVTVCHEPLIHAASEIEAMEGHDEN